MRRPYRDIYGRPRVNRDALTVERYDAFAAHNKPVLGAPVVRLIAQSRAGPNDDLLDLVIGGVDEDFVATLRPFIALSRHETVCPIRSA